jgi:hypothetical protein
MAVIYPQYKKQDSVSIKPTQIILHSLANSYNWAGGVGWLLDPKNALESHYAIRKDGYTVQLVPDTLRAEANYRANRRPDGTGAISVETDSDKFGVALWSDEQVDAIVDLLTDLCRKHGIPARLCRSASDPGIGWHIMWGSPGEWTPVAKACPGPGRIVQMRTQILPRVQANLTGTKGPTKVESKPVPVPVPVPEEDDFMAMFKDRDELREFILAVVVEGNTKTNRSEGISGAGDLTRLSYSLIPQVARVVGEELDKRGK